MVGLKMRIDENLYNKMPSDIKQLFVKLPNHGSEAVLAGFPNTNGPWGKGKSISKTASWKHGSKERFIDNGIFHGDSGSAARFFYCAKASRKDRTEGLDNEINNHPCVKSTALMQYLCRLITPPLIGSRIPIIIDPFMGSGSTGKGAILEGFDFIGIEQDAEYFKIAEARIQFAIKKKQKMDSGLRLEFE